MKHNAIIVIQKAGEEVTPAYLERVFKEYGTYMGVAAVDDKGKLAVSSVKGKPGIDLVKAVTAEYGKKTIVFSFGKADNAILDEDMQPFPVLKDKDGSTLMAAFLDGGFEGYSVVKSTHTDEYHAVLDFIRPKIEKIHRVANSGIPGLLTELADPLTNKEFQNAWSNRGNITLFCADAEPVTFQSNNIQQGKFNWGWTSHAMGYKEQTVVKSDAAPVVADKPLTMLEKLQAKMRGEAPAEVKTPDVKVTAPPKTDTVIHKQEISEDLEWVGPAPALTKDGQRMTNQMKHDWWMGEIGYVPDAYKKDRCKVQRKKGTKIGVLAALANKDALPKPQEVATPISNDTIKAAAATSMAAPQPDLVKDTSVKNVMTTEVMPILSPKQKLKVQTEWMKSGTVEKVLGDDMKKTFDPKLLKTFEENYQTFTDGLGVGDLDNTMGLSFEQIKGLGVVDIHALAVFAFNCRNERFAFKMQLEQVLANPSLASDKLKARM